MKKNLPTIVAALFLVFLAMVVYGHSVGESLNRDEHQFLAPALLLAREGLLPYRDVALFHQPYTILLQAALAGPGDSPLLVARLISATAAFLTALLIFAIAIHAAKNQPPWIRLAGAVALVTLWFGSELFTDSSGRIWNHDLPTLFALLGFSIVLIVENPRSWHWLLAGLFAGLAVGGRLTMAPFAALLPLSALLCLRWPFRRRLTLGLLGGLGVFLAFLPSLWLYLQSPAGYLFGNFEFPRLPLLAEDNERILKTISPWRKLRFFFKEVFRDNLPLALALIGVLVFHFRAVRFDKKTALTWIFLALALLAGAFAPTRYEMQHFYIVAPLAALLAAWHLRKCPRWLPLVLLAASLLNLFWARDVLKTAGQLFRPDEWDISRLHKDALDLRRHVTTGKILTLAPITPMEAGLSVYPQLATGRFGWRFGYLVAPDRRQKLGLLAETELKTVLDADPPAGILTGVEDEKLEKAFLRYAQLGNYRPVAISDDATLWVRQPPASAP